MTLRLLGKLGGKNRRFLRELSDVVLPEDMQDPDSTLSVEYFWNVARNQASEESVANQNDQVRLDLSPTKFSFPLPLDRAVLALRIIALSPPCNTLSPGQHSDLTIERERLRWSDSSKLWTSKIETIDLMSYCSDVMKKTKRSQADAALAVVRCALAATLAVAKCNMDDVLIEDTQTSACGENEPLTFESLDFPVQGQTANSKEIRSQGLQLKRMGVGLMYGCLIPSTHKEACRLLTGFETHLFLIVMSHQQHFVRIDANGSPSFSSPDVHTESDNKESVDQTRDGDSERSEQTRSEDVGRDEHSEPQKDRSESTGKLGPLKPFGYFRQAGPLEGMADPLVINEAIAEFLSETSTSAIQVGLESVSRLIRLAKQTFPHGEVPGAYAWRWGLTVFFENLLSTLFQACVSVTWNRRYGIQEGICEVLGGFGKEWSIKYELEIMTVALFSVKSACSEVANSSVEALEFFVRISFLMYGWDESSLCKDGFIHDMFACLSGEKEQRGATSVKSQLGRPSEAVLLLLLAELPSTKQLVR